MTWNDRSENPQGCRRVRVTLGVMVFLVGGFSLSMLEATEYYVARNHPNASDSNDGRSLASPFKTLGRGVLSLVAGDTLSIKEGIYREPIVISASGTASKPIVIRAYPGDEGNVVIRGSNVVKGWTNDGGGLWSVPWQPLPKTDYPESWPDVDEYSRRREIVFFNGSPLEQVLSGSALTSGRFWMDDAAQRMRIRISGDPNASQVEISVRTQGVMAAGKSNLVFRGLRIEHVSTEIWIGAIHLGSNDRVEDCRVEYNNGNGIMAFSNSVFIRTTSRFNGRLGIALNGSNSLVESSETSHNSWRYGPRWEAGGIKILGGMPSNNRFVRHTAKHNNGIGIWFDTTGSGNVVEASFFEGNVFAGLEFEATIGPNWAINNVVVGTVKAEENGGAIDGSGILVYDASHTYLYNNTIVDVSGPGIAIAGNERSGGFQTAYTQVHNNIVVGSGRAAVDFSWLSGAARQEPRVSTHHFDNNLYFDNPTTVVFPIVSTPYDLGYWSLSEWQINRGEDTQSLSEAPRFIRPSVADFSLMTGSPAVDSGRNLTEVPWDFLGRLRPQDYGLDIGAYECPRAGGCGHIFGSTFENGGLFDWSFVD